MALVSRLPGAPVLCSLPMHSVCIAPHHRGADGALCVPSVGPSGPLVAAELPAAQDGAGADPDQGGCDGVLKSDDNPDQNWCDGVVDNTVASRGFIAPPPPLPSS